MPIEWITAATALRYLSHQQFTYNEQRSICERAHSGLIDARAETLIWNGEEHKLRRIPKEFWWAEGHEALNQNWETGDFSTWIDQKVEVKAFGVSFDFLAITDLIPAELRAEGMRRISVAANPAWIHARDLTKQIYVHRGTSSPPAGSIIVDACALGQLTARAARASNCASGSPTIPGQPAEWVAIEWDVPIWFWRDFTKPGESSQNWQLGTAKGKGRRGRITETIELQGLHFHRSGLAFLGLPDNESEEASKGSSNRGRRPKYDWSAACVAIYGQLERGDLKPRVQADIEKALIAYLSVGDDGPPESTVRPYAKLVWEEFQKP